MLNTIKTKIEQQLKREGVVAEITFIRADMFSMLCDDAKQFVKGKQLMDAASQKYDSEECDEECGFCAYYKF